MAIYGRHCAEGCGVSEGSLVTGETISGEPGPVESEAAAGPQAGKSWLELLRVSNPKYLKFQIPKFQISNISNFKFEIANLPLPKTIFNPKFTSYQFS
jgi:hypothetical protein